MGKVFVSPSRLPFATQRMQQDFKELCSPECANVSNNFLIKWKYLKNMLGGESREKHVGYCLKLCFGFFKTTCSWELAVLGRYETLKFQGQM